MQEACPLTHAKDLLRDVVIDAVGVQEDMGLHRLGRARLPRPARRAA